MAIRTDLNGKCVRQAGHLVEPIRLGPNGKPESVPPGAAIYLVDRGQARHVPDPATFNNLFVNWTVMDVELSEIDVGADLTDGTILAQASGDPAVYLIDSGVKRHIASPATMTQYNFNWKTINHVAPILIASIPAGDQIG